MLSVYRALIACCLLCSSCDKQDNLDLHSSVEYPCDLLMLGFHVGGVDSTARLSLLYITDSLQPLRRKG